MTTPNTFATVNGIVNFNRGTKAYQLAMQAIEFPGTKISTCYTSGSGRYTSNQDHHFATKTILNKLDVQFTEGNDAPRGGKTGQWVMVAEGQSFDWMENFKKEKAAKKAEAEAIAESYRQKDAAFKAAIQQEAASIENDEKFISEVREAGLLNGGAKSAKCASAFKGLLQRKGIEKINTDFWQVFRILKSRIK
jgi:hypothetical protein